MDFIPEYIDNAVVLNAVEICNHGIDCRLCPDVAISVHNWLVSTDMSYLIVDFQDEKEVCSTILIEILQLRKRLRFPFIFAGLMERAKTVLASYAYNDHPFFVTPEEAVKYLRTKFPELVANADANAVKFGEPIPCVRNRQSRGEGDVETEEAAVL